jgi:hypothetical protein
MEQPFLLVVTSQALHKEHRREPAPRHLVADVDGGVVHPDLG